MCADFEWWRTDALALFLLQICGGFPDAVARCCQLLDDHVSVDFVVRPCGITKLTNASIGNLTHISGSRMITRCCGCVLRHLACQRVQHACRHPAKAGCRVSQSCNETLVSSESPLKIPPTVRPAGHQHGVPHRPGVQQVSKAECTVPLRCMFRGPPKLLHCCCGAQSIPPAALVNSRDMGVRQNR